MTTSPDDTGGWLQKFPAAAPVVPGQRLRLVRSRRMYSIGRGDDSVVTFRQLPVGRYVFRARATDEFGRPTGPSLRIPVEMLPPFYQTAWFRLLAVGVGLAAAFAVIRYLTWRKMQVQLQRLERQRAVEEERTRLARDLHDEMGARLTQIALLATRAQPPGSADDPAHEPVRQIHEAVRELATALDEIVWAANPTLDTLEGFGNYLTLYAGRLLRDGGLRCRLEIPTLLPARTLTSATRHRLMMAVKEALTNVLKHAGAAEVRITLTLTGDLLEVTVADDGRGFDPATVARRNGLDNLSHRLAEAGGVCEIESRPGAGACVRLQLPLPAQETAS
jgi:signal transduction histidine kinase